MRYIIKGGVWKNSEDEILKAAVMKYGLNQWSRISSLLVRKSAKQCKARWYEWLDPSIKKTEWTREEEEKLLHLAKIFPCQWRTIAPIVGRTPAQCVEHYDKLLDQAQGKEEDENDPRKLKPGEIDPTPETKPARPDPIDMDEDEKEMLAEARVRLANTKGKKAKRKAREKQIEEARRLASLQKKRELKAAGIDFVIKKKTNSKKMDYNAEVPFERKVPNFAFIPGPDEDPKPNVKLGNIVLQTLEGKRREEEEENLRKIDQKKIKKLKDKDLPLAIEKINKANTTIGTIRTKLTLPSPQMSDKDLELLGKLNSMDLTTNDLNPATRALLGDYSQREPTPASIRTPRFHDAILKEAQNVIALQNVETPLIGGANMPLNNPDFSGLTPKTKIPSTPNILAQTLNTLNNNLPLSNIQTPVRRSTDFVRNTPIHDELKLNSDDLIDRNWEISSQTQGVEKISEEKIEKIKFIQQKQFLKTNLSTLPKPKNEFQISIPEIEDEDSKNFNKRELDAEELEKIRIKERQLEYEETLKMRSLAVQKNLPRPFSINDKIYNDIIENEKIPPLRRQIEKMINEEMVHLLGYDSLKFPYPHSKPINFHPEPTPISKHEIKVSENLILAEIDNIKGILKHGELDQEYLERTWEENLKNIHYDKERKKFVDISQYDKFHRASILQSEYNTKKELYLQDNKNLNTMEQKLNILLGGYGKRLNQIQHSVEEVFFEFDQKAIEKQVFQQLSSQERINQKIRLEEIQNYYNKLTDKEKLLQKKYESLLDQKEEEIKESLNGSDFN